MKKLIAFILLGFLFFNCAGYHLFFFLRKQEIRTAMWEEIRSPGKHKDVEELILPLNEKGSVNGLEWEGDDEFRMAGKMYDVVDKRIEKDSMIIRCINDTKEEKLLEDYAKVNRDDPGNPSARHHSVQLLKLAQSLYVEPPLSNFFCYDAPGVKHSPVFQRILVFLSEDILTPPPQRS